MASTTTPDTAKKWYELFAQNPVIVFASPTSPDGDSIGAQLALKGVILAHFPQTKVYLYHEQPVPPRFGPLPGVENFLHKETATAAIPWKDVGLLVVLDGGHDRVGAFLLSKLPPTVVITQVDHHAVEGKFAYALRWHDSHVSSTGELVYRLLNTPPFQAGKLTPAIASALYISLIFDTGFFRHDCTGPETLRMAAKLFETGIPFTKLAEECLLLSRFEGKKLLATALGQLKRLSKGRVSIATLSYAQWIAQGATEDDREGLIDEIFLIRGVEIGALIMELQPNVTKISFRSRTDFDVASFARSLAEKGGGHRKAAGCTLEMTADAAEALVIKGLADAGFKN